MNEASPLSSGEHHHHHPLQAALYLTASFALVELVGGLMSGSLALLADAGHMASDVAALMLAAVARKIAGQAAHAKMTYGYGRANILAAQLNGLMLWFLSGWIAWEAVGRLAEPPEVQGMVVVWVAVAGLVVNLIVMRWLHHEHDINTRAAYWHVVGDMLGSVAAIVAGVVIITTGWMLVDPLLSFLVAAILAWGGWRLVKETTLELMDAVPDEVQTETLIQHMEACAGVVAVHHVHVWRLPDSQMALSAHVQVKDMQAWQSVLDQLQAILQQSHIEHSTLQAELREGAQCICCAAKAVRST